MSRPTAKLKTPAFSLFSSPPAGFSSLKPHLVSVDAGKAPDSRRLRSGIITQMTANQKQAKNRQQPSLSPHDGNQSIDIQETDILDELPFDLPNAADSPQNKASSFTTEPLGQQSEETYSTNQTSNPIDTNQGGDISPVRETENPTPEDQPEPRQKLSISQRAISAQQSINNTSASYLEGLNPEQRKAVETLDGPVLVLAGAGTGKTRVLTTRIAHILASNRAYSSQILAVTFTNKAAREMRERVETLLGGNIEGMPWLGTFHSIGVKIMRRHAELINLKSGFTILDTDDQIRLMKQVIEAEGVDKERWPARQLAALIDGWKNRGLTPDKVPAGEASSFGGGKGAKLYTAYQSRLKDLNAADFGDLLLECLRLLTQNPDILAEYHNRFRFILVDEYQDTNVAQHLWLRLLSQASPNICCVGDDDQSIYGWRGAEVDNILRFEKEFKNATTIRLERNYRSTGHILGAAAGLISQNQNRLGKTLFTDDDLGEKVTLTSHWDDEEEARTIISNIEQLHSNNETLNEIAILVRASSQMRVLEDRLITVGIPYRVIGGPRFYERAEIKDAIAYLGVTQNPSNDLRFERIVNVPKRGFGDTSLKRVRDFAKARQIPLYDAALEIIKTEELTKRARKSLSDLLQSFERWRIQLNQLRHTELAELILDESGYTAMWQNDKSPQAESRLENLKELIRFMHDFDSLEGFLEHVSLVMAADQKSDGDRVSIMTLHAAKGLEFNTVFLPGFEEGLFPHQRSLDESGHKGLEEERRLAYVGLTRAKKQAMISFAQNRRNRGLYQSALPSRFIDELPEEHIEIMETASANHSGTYRNVSDDFSRSSYAPSNTTTSRFETAGDPYESNYNTPGWQRAKNNFAGKQQFGKTSKGRWSKSPKTIEGRVIAKKTVISDFKCGERVFHQKFGYGKISQVDGDKLTIDFEKAGQKRVMDSFVERHKTSD